MLLPLNPCTMVRVLRVLVAGLLRGAARHWYTTDDGSTGSFEIQAKQTPELVVGKVLMAARDKSQDGVIVE